LSKFDKIKTSNEVRKNSQQVGEGEQAVEKRLGMNSQDNQTSPRDQNNAPQNTATRSPQEH
jgi:hypothetical protein